MMREFQSIGTACAKALRQEGVWWTSKDLKKAEVVGTE